MPKQASPPRSEPLVATPSPKAALNLAHAYDAMRERRLDLQHEVDALEEEEKQLKKQLMDMIESLSTTALSDGKKIYALVTKDEPTASSWPELWAHIQKTGDFDLLYRRINTTAVKERWEVGQTIPGVGKFPVTTLSITKAKGAK